MSRKIRRAAVILAAAGLAGAGSPLPVAHAEQDFGGFLSEAWAAPVKIEVYEPTIPIPAEPQAELELAYTKVEAASGPASKGIASWIWPGDPVGTGFKTFGEALGLPEPVYENGYPVQVNSKHPGGPEKEADEPFPGSNMRTSAGPDQTVSQVGWSSNGRLNEESGGDEKPDTPGLPELPVPGAGDPLKQLSDALKGVTGERAAEEPAEDEPGGPGLPPELAALVDADGFVSVSRAHTGGDVIKSLSISKISNLSLLGGVITADSVRVATTTTSDGKKATADGTARIVGLEFAGTPINVTRDGVEAAGEPVRLDQLPADPGKALEALGITFVLPKGVRTAKQAAGEATYQGLQVVIDTRPLREYLKDVPLADIFAELPIPDEGRQLKGLLNALATATPRVVITLGNAASEAATVPKIELPTIDPSDLTGAGGPATGSSGSVGGSTSAGGGSLGAGVGAGDLGGAVAPGLDEAGAGSDGALAAAPMSAGLPPLASVPGALLVGGLILASGLGWWLQRVGGFVLGGAGSCAHGLETGVPDLRKA